jgi:hypothetical protein
LTDQYRFCARRRGLNEAVQKSHKQTEPKNGSVDAIQAHRPVKFRHFRSSLYIRDGRRLTARTEDGSPDFSPSAGETAARLSIGASIIEFAVNRPEKSR